MRPRRPQPVTIAAILLVILSRFGFPWPWLLLFPGVEQPPAFVFYIGFVVGIVGLVVAVGLWMLKACGATGPPSLFVCSTFFRECQGYSWDQPLEYKSLAQCWR